MTQSADRTKALEDLASILLDFLPGPGPGYPVIPASFQGIARELELGRFWQGYSKAQAVETLLEGTLKNSPEKFPPLLLKIIRVSRESRSSGKNTLTLHDLDQIRNCLKRLDIDLPDLSSGELTKGLPARHAALPTKAMQRVNVDLNSRMRKELVALTMMPADEQGYALELFLNKLFANSDLNPCSPFRQTGEHIGGTFNVGKTDFQLHAVWKPIEKQDEIRSIVEASPQNTKCLLISLRGFSDEVKEFLSSASNPHLLAADVRDIFLVLDGGANLAQVIALKTRAAERGKSLLSAEELLWS